MKRQTVTSPGAVAVIVPTGPDGRVFEDIADAMPQMVWLAGPDGETTYHNHRILEYICPSQLWLQLMAKPCLLRVEPGRGLLASRQRTSDARLLAEPVTL
jgi:hypothetical protein